MSEKSYRGPKNPPIVDKTTTFTKGWYRSLREKISQLTNDLSGLRERVKSPKNNNYAMYQDMRGLPASYKRDFIFRPEDAITQVPAWLTWISGVGGGGLVSPTPPGYPVLANQPANFILRSGQTYNIDVQMPGDGIFVAKYLNVEIYQRLAVRYANGTTQIMRVKMFDKTASNILTGSGIVFRGDVADKVRFSITGPDFLDPTRGRSVEYFWNIVDRSSGRQYADELLSCNFLLPYTAMPAVGIVSGENSRDGDFFVFDKPWIFERDSQVEFLFRPITDVFQLDSSSPLTPYGVAPFNTVGFDDLENGKRDSSIVVRVELHGAKFLNKQDALKYGARFFEARENQEVGPHGAPGPGGNIHDDGDGSGAI